MQWSVEEGDKVVGVAMMSPPHPLVVTRATQAAVDALVEHLHRAAVALPGVVSPTPSRFADAWCALRRCGWETAKQLRLFSLDRVLPPRPADGSARLATLEDAPLIVSWAEAFFREVDVPQDREAVARLVTPRIGDGRVLLWCDPAPVSVAGCAGPTPGGMRVNFVYTPPGRRGRGYASACVAALSQRLLDSGRRLCFLITDLASPTPNRIYQAIGYQPVCDFEHVNFVNQT
jgi:GNAT superfamily N-acetyltransferase